MNKRQNPYLYVLLTIFISFSCSDTSLIKENSADSFDRQLLLENVTDNIIIPAFDDFNQKMVQLDESVSLFVSEQSLANLEEVQERWITAYKIWQHIEMFNILKAEEIYFIQKMNTYPASISKIKNNISTYDFDLESNNNWVAQGFPTLDYLLFGIEIDNDNTLVFYQNKDNIAHINYLEDVVDQMVNITQTVYQNWTAARNVFVSSSENTATSSLNLLTNDFIYYFEKGLRTSKFGIPAGVFSANNARVANVEAYYNSTYSKILALEALKAVDHFFQGQGYNSSANGESLKSYLDYMTENGVLGNMIVTKFSESGVLINGLDDNFENQITTNNDLMVNVFNKLQEGVVLLKTDMLSVLSISVDYIDADGD
jgi:hypothetical protein